MSGKEHSIVRKSGIAMGAAGALAAAFATGLAIASPSEDPEPRPAASGPRPFQPVSHPNADLVAPESCEELLGWYVERGLERVTAYGWEHPLIYAELDGTMAVPFDAAGSVEQDAAAVMPRGARATTSETGTNVQESGVDEPDVVKTDGRLLVRVQDGDLVTYDVSAVKPERLASLPLGEDQAELLLVGDRVVVLMQDEGDASQLTEQARVLVVDVADPANPEVVDDAAYSAGLVTARQHGASVRLVLDTPLPDLDFVQPSGFRGEESALEHNQELVRDSELSDWLPTVSRDDAAAEDLLSCDQVALPAEDVGLGTLAVVGMDPADTDTWSATAVATTSRTAYFSADSMYLATAPATIWGCCWVDGGITPTVPSPEGADGATRLYAFDLDGTRTTYVASGQVDGSIRDRWSMDAVDGVLRVAVGPTQRTGNFNSVVTLERDGADLVELGRVDRLGVNETIRSVRWFDDLAFVVTFRQVDPLYAVDLAAPSRPALLGELKIPGYSEYLHPLGKHRLLGIGQDATLSGMVRGARAALFNVSDLTRPRALDTLDYRAGSRAGAGTDPRQFTWLPDRRTALTVIAAGTGGSAGQVGFVSVLNLDGGTIENRMVEVEYGVEVDQVRTVPLPDGRVLLVTGETVSNFEL